MGGPRKGFDVAVLRDYQVIELARRLSHHDVMAIAQKHQPSVIAIDSPRSCAPDGERSREGERSLAGSVCGIRWTPDPAHVYANGYYGWIVEGLRLYRGLGDYGGEVIEVFPTASWTRWHGPRGKKRRSVWSREALSALNVGGVPARTNQDQRDAIGAAMTAQQHSAGRTEHFGEIVVPIGVD